MVSEVKGWEQSGQSKSVGGGVLLVEPVVKFVDVCSFALFKGRFAVLVVVFVLLAIVRGLLRGTSGGLEVKAVGAEANFDCLA